MPTFDELGVAYGDDTGWHALFAPKATPTDIIAKIKCRHCANADDARHEATRRPARLPAGRRFAGKLGDYLKSDVVKWADVAKRAALVPH